MNINLDSLNKNSENKESIISQNKHISIKNNGHYQDNGPDTRIFPGEIHLENLDENIEKGGKPIDWDIYKKKYEEKMKISTKGIS